MIGGRLETGRRNMRRRRRRMTRRKVGRQRGHRQANRGRRMSRESIRTVVVREKIARPARLLRLCSSPCKADNDRLHRIARSAPRAARGTVATQCPGGGDTWHHAAGSTAAAERERRALEPNNQKKKKNKNRRVEEGRNLGYFAPSARSARLSASCLSGRLACA